MNVLVLGWFDKNIKSISVDFQWFLQFIDLVIKLTILKNTNSIGAVYVIIELY